MSKFFTRIIKTELFNFKNVNYGQIKYLNYSSVNSRAKIENNDVLGIYGQNGSGKTAIIIKSANKVAEAHYYRMKGKAGYHRWNIQHQNKDMKP